tara:strand:+ start:96 stop:1079 length:984 start_codon:yes stop_codon:yes gene_type:complete
MRTLRRPMFRIGGSAGEGITSGLAPRQGYDMGELVKQIPEFQKVAKQYAYQPRGVTPADALIEFGLNLASAPPTGSIFSTAAGAAKEPFQRYAQSKASAAEKAYASESDLFKTLIGAYGDIEAAKKGEGAKSYAKQWEVNRIGELMNEISELEIKDPESKQLPILRAQLDKLKPKNPFINFFLGDEIGGKIFKKIKADLLAKDKAEGGENKYSGEDDPNLWKDAAKAFEKEVSGMFNKGGRVGYQQGLSVQPQPVSMQPEMQMPEEMTSISFEELRQRLPAEVTDDIVRLIASSGEAMEDFATIETEQDIANFNKKYGVNLVLPSEA